MPRPRKWRKVCALPRQSCFGPQNANFQTDAHIEKLIMSVDEYESIRLIDYEGLTQEECAQQMGVARTTVQRIYYDARLKIARAFVEGLTIKISGGEYMICDGTGPQCGRGVCQGRRGHGRRSDEHK